MADEHGTVRSDMVFKLALAEKVASVGVELRYDSRKPYEVSLSFNAGKRGRVDWVFARDLLADGLLADSGEGDVHVRPRFDDPAVVVIVLRSPTGQAAVEADVDQLSEFVNETYDIVAPGAEHLWMSIDDALAQLMLTDS